MLDTGKDPNNQQKSDDDLTYQDPTLAVSNQIRAKQVKENIISSLLPEFLKIHLSELEYQ